MTNEEIMELAREGYKLGIQPKQGLYIRRRDYKPYEACALGAACLARNPDISISCEREVASQLNVPIHFVHGFTIAFDEGYVMPGYVYPKEWQRGFDLGVQARREFIVGVNEPESAPTD